jgi:hypothetical protein
MSAPRGAPWLKVASTRERASACSDIRTSGERGDLASAELSTLGQAAQAPRNAAD